MKLAPWAVAIAAAAALLPPPAHAYVRSMGPNNRCLWWRQPAGLPVVANLADGPTGGGCSGQAQVSELIRNSLATWGAATRTNETQACTSFRFDYRGLTTTKAVGFDDSPGGSNENLIVFRHGLCDGDPACGADLEACADQIGCWPHATRANIGSSRTIAITTTSYIPSTGEIVDADMELHDHSAAGIGYWFTCPAPAEYCGNAQPNGACISTDVGSIVTHEAGHMLGLDHPPVQSATMFATYVPGSIDLRTLDIDDVNGVCTVYPAGGLPATTCSGTGGSVPPIQEPPPRDSGGCSTAMGGVLSMIGLAFALGRRRSR